MNSTSADVSKYYWLKYAGDRKTNIATQQGAVSFAKGDLYGVRELRGKDLDEVVDAKTGITFKLAVAKSEALMNKGKPFRGKVVIAAPAAKTKTPKQAPKPTLVKPVKVSPKPTKATDPAKLSIDKQMRQVLRKYKVSIDNLTTAQVRRMLADLCAAKDGATATHLKHWCVANVKSKVAKAAIAKLVVCEDTETSGKKTAQSPSTKLKVKLSEVEMPEVDDFMDDELPSEFLRYRHSESSAKVDK